MGYFVQQFDSLQTGKYAQNYVSSYSIEHNRYNYKRGHILDKLSDILIISIIERDMALLLIINENKCGLTITLAKTTAIFCKVQNRFKTLLFVIIR